jgi:anti-sigma B factor antagonist
MRSFRLKQIGQVMSENTPNPNSSDDSGFNNTQYALTEDGILKVYRVGGTTVLGFGGEDIPSEFNAAHYRAAIADLLRANNSEVVAFDLTGVKLVPSGMLGLLVSLKKLEGLTPVVQVFNPSEDVREVLQITKLNTMIEIHEVDV